MVRLLVSFVAAVLAASSAFAAEPVVRQLPPLEDYGKLPAMAFVTLSPTGQKYAFISNSNGKSRLVVATVENKLIEAPELGAVKVRSLQWAGEDHLLVYTSATVELGIGFTVDKGELGAVLAFDLAHRKAFSVFISQNQTRVANTVVGSYGAAMLDGRWYGFFGAFSYDESGRLKLDGDGRLMEDLYKVDLDTGAFALAAPGSEALQDWLVGPDGKVAARMTYVDANGNWRLFNAGFGGRELARGKSPTRDVRILGFGRTADTLLLGVSGTDHDIVEEVALADGQVHAAHDADEIGRSLHDRLSKLWIGDTFETDDAQSSTLFAAADQAKLRGALKAFPHLIPHLVSYSADFNRMIIFTEGGEDSGAYWFVDIAKRSADPIGGDYPSVGEAAVGLVRWVDYKAGDGLPMRGVLTLPPGRPAKGLPLVVMPHGGPEAHDSLRFDWWAQAFAARGYAVWQPNFRGSDGSGNAFRDAGYGEWGHRMQTDISDGVAELAHQGLIDPKRACIVGGSYGGYAALAGVTVQQGLYRCAASYGGVSDLSGMLDYERDRSGRVSSTVRFWNRFMGVKPGVDLDSVSPARLAARADAPVLLIHGKDDTVVLLAQSQEMERALRRAGKSVELMVLPGADHWLLEEPARIAMIKAMVAFVQKYNPADGAGGTAKAD